MELTLDQALQKGIEAHRAGKIQEADRYYTAILKANPKHSDANHNMGVLAVGIGKVEQALPFFKSALETNASKAQYWLSYIDALIRLDRMVEAKAVLEQAKSMGAEGDGFDQIETYSSFIESVIEELHYVKTKWELNTTRNGFQANVDIFKNPVGNVSSLKAIILDEIDIYYSKFKEKTCTFIKKWPSTNNIKGWHVVLKTQGHQLAHIHPTGWLSGVVYLKVVPALEKNEGAIEFSLNSKYYHHENSPSVTFQPERGDIVLFPSSLHHRTIPFTTDTDRIIVSFDLVPEGART